MTPPIQLLTASDIALALGVRRTLAYELLRTGRIASVRIGRLVRVAPAALDEYIAKGGHAPDDTDGAE